MPCFSYNLLYYIFLITIFCHIDLYHCVYGTVIFLFSQTSISKYKRVVNNTEFVRTCKSLSSDMFWSKRESFSYQEWLQCHNFRPFLYNYDYRRISFLCPAVETEQICFNFFSSCNRQKVHHKIHLAFHAESIFSHFQLLFVKWQHVESHFIVKTPPWWLNNQQLNTI
jgi:hypothetical protein